MMHISEEILLELANKLSETSGPFPRCSLKLSDGRIVWNGEKLIFEAQEGTRVVVGLQDLRPSQQEFLESCLMQWFIDVENYHGPVDGAYRTPPEA